MTDYHPTPRTEVRRMPGRGSYDREIVHAILDQSILCHVGVSIDGKARVVPTAILRVGEFVYIHGSNASQLLKSLARGLEACITVSILDGLVAGRSGFNCAVDYRSVMIFATGEEVTDRAEKERVLDQFIQHMIPGHVVRAPRSQEIGATALLRFPLVEASAKVRDTGVGDFEADLGLDTWAGVIPLRTTAGEPITSPSRSGFAPVPDYARSFAGWAAVADA